MTSIREKLLTTELVPDMMSHPVTVAKRYESGFCVHRSLIRKVMGSMAATLSLSELLQQQQQQLTWHRLTDRRWSTDPDQDGRTALK